MSKERETYMDIAKGIAIILVMIGHSKIASVYAPFGQEAFIRNSIYSFHMPLFFIISGYFISRTKPAFPYIILRNIKILLALFICAFIKLLFYYSTSDTSSLPILRYFMYIFTRDIYYLWFFWALIISSSLVILMRPLKYTSAVIVSAIGIAAFKFQHVYPFPYCYLYIGLYSAPFVYAGYLARELQIFQKQTSPYILILSIIILIAAGSSDIAVNFLSGVIPYGILSVIAALSGSYLIIQLARFWELFKWGKSFLIWSGKHVMLIISVHFLEQLFIRSQYTIPIHIELPLILITTYSGVVLLLLAKQWLIKVYHRRRH